MVTPSVAVCTSRTSANIPGTLSQVYVRCRFHKLFGHMANSGEPSEHVDQTMKALNNVPGSGVDAKGFWKEMAIFLSKCKALHNQRNGNYTLGLAASPTATGA